jgi:asparagine synthase (glutamine-hydrolysing)
MCGILGFHSPHINKSEAEHISNIMLECLRRRGPDGKGLWSNDAGLSIGHTRLSIVDLSSNGSQPMRSADNRFIVSFNGEIYNHLQLRKELLQDSPNISWQSTSDTETIANCIMTYGFKDSLKKFQGMFAISVWDKSSQTLQLAIDRFGEKPIYYGSKKNSFAFASDLNALRQHPDFHALEIDRGSLGLFFKYNCIPSPHTIFQGIHKLEGGDMLSIQLSNKNRVVVEKDSYWSCNNEIESSLNNQILASDDEIQELIYQELVRVIDNQMMGDVPIGVFLSGGIDSSLIACLMQEQSSKPIRSFSIGFEDRNFNESDDAKFVADIIGSQHTSLIMSNKDIVSSIYEIPKMYSEPFSDSSQIPTYLVSKLAASDVKVALTGDGADEIFGGYNRYHAAFNTWQKLSSTNSLMKLAIETSVKTISPKNLDKAALFLSKFLPQSKSIRLPGYKLKKLADSLQHKKNEDFYISLLTHWEDDSSIVLNSNPLTSKFSDVSSWATTDNFQHQMMAADTKSYLSDDILVKIDRAAMWNSLETRAPFLDHQLFQTAWKIPFKQKINMTTKQPLRNILKNYLPESHLKKPKMGFGIPVDSLLRNELSSWAMDLLDERSIESDGFLNSSLISNLWAQHLRGDADHGYLLWDVVMFQSWLKETQI